MSGKSFNGNILKLDYALKKRFPKNNSSVSEAPDRHASVRTGTSQSQVPVSMPPRVDAVGSLPKHPSNPNDAGILVGFDNSMMDDLKHSVIVTTLKPRTITDILNQLDLLGYNEVIVRGLSRFKYLLTFLDKAAFKDLDMSLLGLGFLSCDHVKTEDLVIQRIMWVEISGLPIFSWCLDNLSSILKDWGNIVSVPNKLDDDFFFTNPIVGLQTSSMNKVRDHVTVHIDGKNFPILIKEIDCQSKYSGISQDYNEDNLKDGENKDSVSDNVSCQDSDEGEDIDSHGGDDDLENSGDVAEVTNDLDPVNFHNISPCFTKATPSITSLSVADSDNVNLCSTDHQAIIPYVMLDIINPQIIDSHTADPHIWQVRDVSNTSLTSNESDLPSKSSSSNLNQPQYSDNSLGSIVHNLNCLKGFKRRGRPRKFPNRIVKAFQLPRGSKIKIKRNSCQGSRNLTKEAENIIDSSMHMGLTVIGSRKDAISSIITRLEH